MRKIISSIYAAVQESRITSHKFSDETCEKVYELKDIAEQAAREHEPSARIIVENVEAEKLCKRYDVSIEDEHTGEKYGGGQIVACFAGSMETPWDAYDLCATWWSV